jgi:hypothetical protein
MIQNIHNNLIALIAHNQRTGELAINQNHRPPHAIRIEFVIIDDPIVMSRPWCGSEIPIRVEYVVLAQPKTCGCEDVVVMDRLKGDNEAESADQDCSKET